jgi:hypothetical protein
MGVLLPSFHAIYPGRRPCSRLFSPFLKINEKSPQVPASAAVTDSDKRETSGFSGILRKLKKTSNKP